VTELGYTMHIYTRPVSVSSATASETPHSLQSLSALTWILSVEDAV